MSKSNKPRQKHAVADRPNLTTSVVLRVIDGLASKMGLSPEEARKTFIAGYEQESVIRTAWTNDIGALKARLKRLEREEREARKAAAAEATETDAA